MKVFLLENYTNIIFLILILTNSSSGRLFELTADSDNIKNARCTGKQCGYGTCIIYDSKPRCDCRKANSVGINCSEELMKMNKNMNFDENLGDGPTKISFRCPDFPCLRFNVSNRDNQLLEVSIKEDSRLIVRDKAGKEVFIHRIDKDKTYSMIIDIQIIELYSNGQSLSTQNISHWETNLRIRFMVPYNPNLFINIWFMDGLEYNSSMKVKDMIYHGTEKEISTTPKSVVNATQKGMWPIVPTVIVASILIVIAFGIGIVIGKKFCQRSPRRETRSSVPVPEDGSDNRLLEQQTHSV